MRLRAFILKHWRKLLFGVGVLATIILVTPPDCHLRHACQPRETAYICGDLGDCSECPDDRFCSAREPRRTRLPLTGLPTASSTSTSTFGFPRRTKTQDCVSKNGLPDPGCTPGAVLKVETAKVCAKGYSGSARAVNEAVKNQVYKAYGIATRALGQYEIDHFVPLELGGSNDIANLWPEVSSPKPGFHEKDKVENFLHLQVCKGAMTLPQAQQKISTDWRAVFDAMSPAAKNAAPVCAGGCS
jgi:hypothetical protein